MEKIIFKGSSSLFGASNAYFQPRLYSIYERFSRWYSVDSSNTTEYGWVESDEGRKTEEGKGGVLK